MDSQEQQDTWDSGEAYEAYVGRWSRKVARVFLAWLDMPAGGRWLDVGCGMGALVGAVLSAQRPLFVAGVDRARAFVSRAGDTAGESPVAFVVADAARLPFGNETFDSVVSGLVLNFLPRPGSALQEMRRVTRPGGRVGLYVWDYAEGMQAIRKFWDVAVRLRPGDAALDEANRFPVCQPSALLSLFGRAGYRAVSTEAIDVATTFRSFDDYWSPFLGGQGPAPGYTMSLPRDERDRLRDQLRRELVPAPDGSIRLTARAWAVQGTV